MYAFKKKKKREIQIISALFYKLFSRAANTCTTLYYTYSYVTVHNCFIYLFIFILVFASSHVDEMAFLHQTAHSCH